MKFSMVVVPRSEVPRAKHSARQRLFEQVLATGETVAVRGATRMNHINMMSLRKKMGLTGVLRLKYRQAAKTVWVSRRTNG